MWEITLCGKYEDILYLVDMENILKETFSSGFFAGIKSMFVEIWNGIKYVFK